MLTPAWFDLRYHALQSQAWRSTERFVNLACGRGSGKTDLARRRVVRMLPLKKDWPDPLYFYALPTVAQAKRVAWDKLIALIPPDWVTEINKSEMFIRTRFGSTLYVLGMDKPERTEGVQWDFGVIDESSDVRPGTFARSLVPALEHRKASCWRIGVPKRYGIGAAEFKEFFDRGLQSDDNNILSLTWPSGDILTPDQLSWAQDNLDARDFDEQYGATWQSTGGGIFHAFDEVLNVSDKVNYNHSRTIVVGSDFNVNPMSWVVGHRSNTGLEIFDQLWIRNTNTMATLNTLFARYGSHVNGWEFFGDASGSARKTSASESDYLQIKGDDRFRNARIYYPKSNPRIANRFAACNRLMCNAKGERNLQIHPRCVNLINDLRYRTYKEGTMEPDDHGDMGHMSDALGYIIHRCFPIRFVPHDPGSVSTNTLPR